MKHLIPFLAAALLAACAHPAPAPQTRAELASPDGALRLEFSMDADGVPYYSLSREDVDVLLPSRLGFTLRGTVKAERLAEDKAGHIFKSDAVPPVNFDRGFELVGTETDSFDEVWEPVWGEESQIRNHYNELLVHLRQPDSERALDVRFRLFDDGLGFRYEFPGGQSLVHFVIQEELTEFRRDNIGFIFQSYNLMPNLTSLQNLKLIAELVEKPMDADDALDVVGLLLMFTR